MKGALVLSHLDELGATSERIADAHKEQLGKFDQGEPDG